MKKTLSSLLRQVGEFLLNLILPEHCACCQKTGSLLCNNCYQLICFNLSPTNNQLTKQDYLDQVLILAIYQSPISNLIKLLKYRQIKRVAVVLADLIYIHLKIPNVEIITWAPISKKRLNERGFNQAQLIAEHLATLLHRPSKSLILKQKDTIKQARSTLEQRLNNLDHCFEANSQHSCQEKTVLIIDDVTSTGSTLSECGRILKSMGAKRVIGLAVARS